MTSDNAQPNAESSEAATPPQGGLAQKYANLLKDQQFEQTRLPSAGVGELLAAEAQVDANDSGLASFQKLIDKLQTTMAPGDVITATFKSPKGRSETFKLS